ncbi:GntR family transcriptional regulator [Salsuginibacillus halophilus]|uniref:GntR family transcriptional regulator n=1 Tax=Salsuginibacillus halophilus TaxID=517424 RepID=A0A2P8HCY4_9BACI|nr:FadR/GntR family transcriptional regulator [Salsuginibacillus halophilus]PSL44079.1 GntR family transcriptional regulator [Salsuginibacillus halophilus]
MAGENKMYVEVLEAIQHLIHNDGLKKGDRLPSERELSDRLNVARSSVREALRALEVLELIETRRGGGTYISGVGGRRLVELIASFILKDEDAREDLKETRKIIEAEAVRLACRRSTKKDIEGIEENVIKYEKAIAAGEVPVEEDYTFHHLMVKTSHNNLLHHIWIPLVEYSKAAIKDSLDRSGRPRQALYEHREIVEAVKAGREEQAVNALTQHLDRSMF